MAGDRLCRVCGRALGAYDLDGICGRCEGEASGLAAEDAVDPDAEDIE